tara:strand:+ start:2417 stop:3472 length:1056 start_codon:yes stop_codon:yes gene_type:complete
MTILITGGAGFIGSHTILELVKNNKDIVVIDSLINSSVKSIYKVKEILTSFNFDISKIKFLRCDIKNEKKLREIFRKQEDDNKPINSVIHFAGLKSVKESIDKPILYWENNVLGTIKLIKVMQEFNCTKLVFSSSATVYDCKENKKINESTKLNPINPYGETKLVIENLLKSIYDNDNKNWRIICLRYFNPIGADPSGLIGESPKGIPNNIFPYLCQVASGKLDVVRIFGNNWPTKDGTGVRDYIHVLDLASAHLKALNYIEENKPACIFLNVGTSIGTSVLQLIKTFEQVNRCKVNYVFTDRRKGDQPFVVADNKLLIELFNWKPKFNLEDMCRDGWRWQINNPSGFKNF